MAEDRCSEQVYDGRADRVHSCTKGATVQRGGRWYCPIHDPEYIKAQAAKREDRVDKRYAEQSLQWERTMVMSKACEGLTTEELSRVSPALIRKALAAPDLLEALLFVKNEDRMTEKLRAIVLKAIAKATEEGK